MLSTRSWIPINMSSTHSATSQLSKITKMSQPILSVAEHWQHTQMVAKATAKDDNEMAEWSALDKPLCFIGAHYH